MENTNAIMAEAVSLSPQTSVLDLGCGYGATARYLAANYGCRVTGTNISEKELALARVRSQEAGLDGLLSFEYGDFHNLPYADDSYDVVWSQEAFLHAADKNAVLSECRRVLKPGGVLIFTDILVRHDTPGRRPGPDLRPGKIAGYVGLARLPQRPSPAWNSRSRGRKTGRSTWPVPTVGFGTGCKSSGRRCCPASAPKPSTTPSPPCLSGWTRATPGTSAGRCW